MTTPTRWVSWAAVSSLPQAKKISNEDQLTTNREHCARHGGQLVAELVVPGESRSIVLFEDAARRIDAYARLKQLIDARAFDVLVYLDRSRLGRKASLSMAVVELCHEAGIIAYETDNPPASLAIGHDYDDALLGAIKSVGAQQEVRKMVERHESGMIGRVKRGLMTGKIPFGYLLRWQSDNGKLQPVYDTDPAAAAVVRQVFDLYLAGAGYQVIADALTGQGALTATGRTAWTASMIDAIVARVWRYAGHVEWNRINPGNRPYYRVRGNWQPIIDDSTARLVEDERERRAANHKLANAGHLLTGVCYCATCGNAMVIHRLTRYGYKSDYARCYRHVPGGHVATDLIMDALRALIADLPNRDLDSLLADDDGSSAAVIAAQVAQQHKALAGFASAKARADAAYVDGHMSASDYAAQVKRLRTNEEHIRAELTRLDGLAAADIHRQTRRLRIDEVVADGLAMLASDDTAAANLWLRHHIRVWADAAKTLAIEWL